MQIDRIKISQEVNFLGMPTWIGMEASLLPDENEKEGLKALQKSITEYLQEENKPPSNKWKAEPTDKPTMSPEEQLIQAINGCSCLDGDNGLLSYRIPASLNPSTKAAYDLKVAFFKK